MHPKITPGDERTFTVGACEVLAIALHDETGWPIIKVTDSHNVCSRGADDWWPRLEGTPDEERAKTSNKSAMGSAMHWMVLRPDGKLIDIDGAHEPLDIVQEYNEHADEAEAAIGRSTRPEAVEESEQKGTTASVAYAKALVPAVLELARQSRPNPQVAGVKLRPEAREIVWYHPAETSATTIPADWVPWSAKMPKRIPSHARGIGTWFTEDPEVAEALARQYARAAGSRPIVISAKVTVRSPRIYRTYAEYGEDFRGTPNLRRELIREGYDSVEIQESDTEVPVVRRDLAIFDPGAIKPVSVAGDTSKLKRRLLSG